ncbi:MAG: hypothetical protein IPO09_10130 [Anaeromyxobacter sp.]|nr:hypothetical protein [Anaeromyxobacter sp.]MBL0278531.1 hypothetical protein [Anaeromyxobacter sp.]
MNNEGPALTMSGGLGRVELCVLVGLTVCFAGMGLLPFERFYAESELAPQELLRRLAEATDAPRWWGRSPWDPTDKALEGRVGGNRFIVWTLLKFQRDSFRPVVVGSVEPRGGGSAIRAVLRLHWAVAVFMACWIALPLTVGALGAARLVRLDEGFWAPWLFALAGYLLCMVFFWLGSRRVKRILINVTRT